MSLRLKLQLLVGALTLAFVATLLALQLRGLKASVNEEIAAANRVAAQMFDRLVWLYAAQGTPAMRRFLEGIGRVRANDIELVDAEGRRLYRSPPSPYKAGRDAPAWFAALVAPAPVRRIYAFDDGRLVVSADASRAVLDGWDDLREFVAIALALLVALNALVAWIAARALAPLGRVVDALGALEAGRLATTLPALAGAEAARLGAAFNRMAQVIRERIEAERALALAERRLDASRELTRWIDRRIEDERRQIARELHDEFGQSATAIRSLATSIAQRTAALDPASAGAARAIADESARLYDAMHGMIPRLAPLVIDRFGLGPALAEFVERTRRAHPALELALDDGLGATALAPDAALALYRAAQEAVTNALRHGGAGSIALTVRAGDAADGGRGADGEAWVRLVVDDDGRGLPSGDEAGGEGHHGLRWLRERIEGVGGTLAVGPGPGGRGVRLDATVPAADAVPDAGAGPGAGPKTPPASAADAGVAPLPSDPSPRREAAR